MTRENFKYGPKMKRTQACNLSSSERKALNVELRPQTIQNSTLDCTCGIISLQHFWFFSPKLLKEKVQ